MRILIVHNQLWAHYKSKLFSEIHHVLQSEHPGAVLLVAQIALYESSRSQMQAGEQKLYDYPYRVLFEGSLEQVGLWERVRALFSTFREFDPDVLNVTGYSDWAQVLLMLHARSRGIKVIMSSESSAQDHVRSGWKEKLKRRIVSYADAFFCFGKSSAGYLESLGVPPSRIAVQNAAVIDEDTIRQRYAAAKKVNGTAIDAQRRKFIYVGRLAPEKNLLLLVQAFISLGRRNPDHSWELLLVGEGPMRQELEAVVKEANMAGHIRLEGGCPWYEVPGWLATSDVLILPSTSEPWGLVVNEAMVCGMPVIVSRACGCADDLVQEGTNGFLFQPSAQHELETAMEFFITNPDRIATMGMESLKLVAPFSSTKVAARMVECYYEPVH